MSGPRGLAPSANRARRIPTWSASSQRGRCAAPPLSCLADTLNAVVRERVVCASIDKFTRVCVQGKWEVLAKHAKLMAGKQAVVAWAE